jgi:hypothetical protein
VVQADRIADILELQPVDDGRVVGGDAQVGIEVDHALVDVLEDRRKLVRFAQGLEFLLAQLREIMTDADVALEAAIRPEYRRAGYLDRSRHTPGVDQRREEIAVGTMVGEVVEMGTPGRCVVVGADQFRAQLSDDGRDRHTEQFGEAFGQKGDAQLRIHFPPPVGGGAGEQRELVNHPNSALVVGPSK